MISHVIFFNDTATTEIYTLSLHDALPILTVSPMMRRVRICVSFLRLVVSSRMACPLLACCMRPPHEHGVRVCPTAALLRSEEHTSELQSRLHLVCRLLLEKKK